MTAVTVFAVLAGLGSLVYPFGRDQGNYAYAGWVWLDGGALYKDVFVFKPPATAILHGVATAIFGREMSSIRLFDLGWTAATAVATAAVLTHLCGRRLPGVIAGFLAAYVYYEQNYWTTAQTDGWMALPTILAVWATLRGAEGGRASLGWWVGAGLCAGVAMAFKYTAAAIALPMIVVLLSAARTRGWRPMAVGAAVIAGSGLALLAAVAGWLWARGAWPAFVDCQFNLVPGYVANVKRATPPHWPFTVVMDLVTGRRVRMGNVVLFAGLPALWLLFRPGPGRLGAGVVLAWLAGGLASCAAQGKYFGYHYLMAVPALGAFASLGLTTVFDGLGRWIRSRWALGAIAVLLAAGAVATSQHVDQLAYAWRITRDHDSLDQAWRRSTRYKTNDFSLTDNLKLADYVEAHSRPEDHVFLWGFEPMVNYVAGRKTEGRFLYNYPFAVSWGNPDYERELMDTLTARPPALFVVSSKDSTPGVTGNKRDSKQLFEQFDALRGFVEGGYTLDKEIGRFDIYRRGTP